LSPVVSHGPRTQPVVALTFDDTPDPPWTAQVLDILERTGTRATFYAIGDRAERDPATTQRMLRVGGEVGSHAYDESHLDLRRLRPPELLRSLSRTHEAISRITGQVPVTFRPPFGFYNAQVVATANRFGYTTVLWDIDAHDWESLSAAQVVQNVVPRVQRGSIVLMHAGTTLRGENLTGTVQALPVIIDTLRRRDFRLVTVRELLGR
jgi:peptidoglycan/xylan/chitin deacetylase (PgdA/CDA1 family)